MKYIYYGTLIGDVHTSKLMHPYLTNVLDDLKNNQYYNSNKFDGYLNCPSAIKMLKNTYAVRSGINMYVKFNDSGTITFSFPGAKKDSPGHKMAAQYHEKAEQLRRDLIVLRNNKKRHLSFYISTWFFSEHATYIEQLHPHFENTDFSKNTSSVVGTFDISKWFRPIQPTFVMHNNELNIKRDDALFYVKFPANENYKLIEFDVTTNIHRFSADSTDLKFFKSQAPLNSLYQYFMGRKFDKWLLKEIKNNIIE